MRKNGGHNSFLQNFFIRFHKHYNKEYNAKSFIKKYQWVKKLFNSVVF